MRPIDRVAFGVLVPLWVLVWVLSFASIGRNIVESPLRVHGAVTEMGHPRVSSLQPWAVRTDDPAAMPHPGDTLLEVGGHDLEGAGSVRTIALVWASMGQDGGVPLVVERDGQRLDLVARIPRTIVKWPGLVVSLVFGALAVFGLRRFPDLRVSQVAFPSLMMTALFFGARFGTTPVELLAAFCVQAGSLLFLQPTTARLLRYFPDGRPGAAWARGWPWLFGLNGVLLVDTMFFDSLPAVVGDLGNKFITVVAPIVFIAIALDRYRVSNHTNRRRFKWLLLGFLIASTPGMLVGFASSLRPELGAWFMPAQLGQLAIPICLWIAIARHRLFDIDRVLNVAGVVFVALLVLGLTAVAVGPSAHEALAEGAGVSPSTASFLLVFVAGIVIAPLVLTARAALDRWTFTRRRAREAGVERLLAEIARADKLREIGARLTLDACAIWDARSAGFFVRVDDGWLVVSRQGELPEHLDLDVPTSLESMRSGAIHNDGGMLRDEQRPLVMRLSVTAGLEGVIVLGPDRNGDPFEESDRALLAVVAERVSASLGLLEQRELLDNARALNRELSEGKRQAEAESAEKTALLAHASHDLRQPVQALRLFLGSLGEQVEGEDERALVEKAQLSAIAMQQQFETLLDESRLDAGTVQAQLQVVPLDELLADVHAFLEPLARQKGLELDVPVSGLAVRSDPSLLRSVVQNLVGNAIRFTETGSVRVEAYVVDQEVRIDVVDTGRGMDEDEIEGLFEAGRRGRSASGDSQGAGLGLSIVSRLCELLGHAIRVRSKPGQGSSISVHAEPASVSAGARRPAGVSSDHLAESRIVVIDDDDETREAVARLVRGWGAEVVAGASARDVVESSPGFVPDAALLDYTLRGETGLDALDALERALGTLPAAILTGETRAEVHERIRARGLPLLRKPAAPVQIRAVLSSLVSS